MPWDQVMSKYKAGTLHSGTKKGPKVKSRKQAIAIMLSEKRAAQGGKKEYQSDSTAVKAKAVGGKKKPKKGAIAGMLSSRFGGK